MVQRSVALEDSRRRDSGVCRNLGSEDGAFADSPLSTSYIDIGSGSLALVVPQKVGFHAITGREYIGLSGGNQFTIAFILLQYPFQGLEWWLVLFRVHPYVVDKLRTNSLSEITNKHAGLILRPGVIQ